MIKWLSMRNLHIMSKKTHVSRVTHIVICLHYKPVNICIFWRNRATNAHFLLESYKPGTGANAGDWESWFRLFSDTSDIKSVNQQGNCQTSELTPKDILGVHVFETMLCCKDFNINTPEFIIILLHMYSAVTYAVLHRLFECPNSEILIGIKCKKY